MPEFSILMPVYNAAEFLPRSINSVLTQTFRDFELIIIDDCSTDNSWSVLEDFAKKDSRIKIGKNNINQGALTTRNLLIKKITGKYVAFIDADDEIIPDFLKESKKILEQDNFDIIEFGMQYISKNIVRQFNNLKPDSWNLYGKDVFNKYFTHPSYFPSVCGKIYQAALVRSVKTDNINISYRSDYLFFSVLLYFANSYHFSKKIMYKYHCGDGGWGKKHYSLDKYNEIVLSMKQAFNYLDIFFKSNPINDKCKESFSGFKEQSFHVLLEFCLEGKMNHDDIPAAYKILLKTWGTDFMLQLLQHSILLNEQTPVKNAIKGIFRFGLIVIRRWQKRLSAYLIK